MNILLSLYFFCVCGLFIVEMLSISALTDGITASQSLRDGETLVSNGGSFELGFFSPGGSEGRYLGIWYKNIPVRTVVWVANRRNPIRDSSGLLMINNTGSLVLSHGSNSVVWSMNPTRIAHDPFLQLLDSGNLVARDTRDDNADNYPWQSFDYPSDTLLPGMKLGWDLSTHLNRHITSWKSSDDPSAGELSNGENEGQGGLSGVAEREDLGLPLLDLATVAHATGDFSVDNKLGEGGFGPVYKGVLKDGENIAVKRLSRGSGQGVNEFKNEMKLIAKLQHRNLVGLLACCIEEDEKILVYEYMPNRSLDSFIFDQSRGSILD